MSKTPKVKRESEVEVQQSNSAEVEAQKSPTEIARSLDLSKFSRGQDHTQRFRKEGKITTIEITKPHKQDFVRVHPQIEVCLSLMAVKDEAKMAQKLYLVPSEMVDELAASGLTSDVADYIVALAVTKNGLPFLWPVRVPAGNGGPGESWQNSAFEAMQTAREKWLRIIPDQRISGYQQIVGNYREPVEPKWPAQSFEELLAIAFKGREINSLEHPVILELLGRQ